MVGMGWEAARETISQKIFRLIATSGSVAALSHRGLHISTIADSFSLYKHQHCKYEMGCCLCICKHNHKDKQWAQLAIEWTQPNGAGRFNTCEPFDIPREKQTVSKAEVTARGLIRLCVHRIHSLVLRSHFNTDVTGQRHVSYTCSWNLGLLCGGYFDPLVSTYHNPVIGFVYNPSTHLADHLQRSNIILHTAEFVYRCPDP